jgi:DNA-directed RNA polymerase specialized sigma24 family protein
MLVHAGFDESDADDIAVQACTRLYANGGKQLRSFNRDSQDELIVWLRRIAVNATRDWIRKGWRAKRRERLRRKRGATPDRQTASLAEVESLLKELEADSVVSHDDMERLRRIAGLESETHEPAASARTERRHKQDLERKLREYLGIQGRGKSPRNKGKGTKS